MIHRSPNTRPLLIALVLLITLGGGPAPAERAIRPSDVEGPMTWGAADDVTRLRHLSFSGRPDRATLERAKDEGIVAVIDLRSPDELDFDERSAVEALGMTYHNVPVSGARFEKSAFEAIEALVAEADGQPLLIHCSSSNRVGGWLATHLVLKHGMSVDDALAVARKAGITRPRIEASARTYIAEREAEQRAKDALIPFKKMLKSTLISAMRDQGPKGAVEACRTVAPAIAVRASHQGLSVGRTSHRLRNPANAPKAWMEPLLEEALAMGKGPAPARLVPLDGGRFGYVEPIYAGELCLTCHGEAVEPGLGDHIRQLYPDDRATGFREGELRGLFWVEGTLSDRS